MGMIGIFPDPWGSDLFGSKPTVPTLPKLDLGTEQSKAISANQSALPAAKQLTKDTNAFTQEQITQMLNSLIPNYSGMGVSASRNISSLLKGEIPSDISDLVQNSAAARSLGGGTAGSGMSRNLVARDLGLTSLNLMNEGLSSAESWIRTTAAIYEPSMMNVTSMFVSPAEMASFDVNERNMQYGQEWLKNQIAAMPDPTTAGEVTMSMALMTGGLSAYESGGKSIGAAGTYGSQQPSGGSMGGWNWGGGGGGGGGSNDFAPYSDYSGTYQPEAEATSTDLPASTTSGGDAGGSSGSISGIASLAAMFA